MSSDYIEAAKNYRCESCEHHKPLPQTHKVAMPKKFCFNYEIGIDCLEVKDNSGERYTFLNTVCQGTTFQRVIIVRQGGGMPSSRTCLTALQQHWCAWAGTPKRIVLDRGLHNQGVFLHWAKGQGIDLRDAGVESPEQIGRTERHGGLWKIYSRRSCTIRTSSVLTMSWRRLSRLITPKMRCQDWRIFTISVGSRPVAPGTG